MSNEQLYLVIGIPILFNLIGFLITNMRISDLISRISSLEQDIRDWAKITMEHHADIAAFKEKKN